MKKTKFHIEFELLDGRVETVDIETDDLMYSLEQIGRNRSIREFTKVIKNDKENK
jgi:hypothetical protein|tara:strand:- start:601 stop:765 length:165 start_codon:yes stop_codon:yes gene_type:complete